MSRGSLTITKELDSHTEGSEGRLGITHKPEVVSIDIFEGHEIGRNQLGKGCGEEQKLWMNPKRHQYADTGVY